MKKTIYTFTCLIMLLGLAASCDTTNNSSADSGKVQLLSFGPAGAQLGDTLKFIGNNLDKVTAIVFVGDSVSKSAFLSSTSTLIQAIAPPNAKRGNVILRTPEGDVVSLTPIDFLVAVTITSIETTSGTPMLARPGSNITINGTHLDWISSITFYNATNSIVVTDTFFVSQSASQAVITVPPAAQTGQLKINTTGTKPQLIIVMDNLNIVLPVITDLSPNPVARGSQLTITGSDLDLVTGLLLKGVTDTVKTFDSQTATQLVLTVPQEASFGKITAFSAAGIPCLSPNPLMLVGDLNPLPSLAFPLYDNGYKNGAQNWGWGTTGVDVSNTEQIRVGTTSSVKVTYAANYGAFWLANYNLTSASYSTVQFSIYGGPGTGGNQIKVLTNINDQPNWTPITVTIVEGKWTDYSFPLSSFGPPSTITDLEFQELNWSGVIYITRIGFDK